MERRASTSKNLTKNSSMFIKHLGKRSDLMQRPTLNFLVIALPVLRYHYVV